MNIIKLNNNSEKFPGQYVFLTHWTFIYPLSEANQKIAIGMETYNEYMIEQELSKNDIEYFKLTNETLDWIDWTETERINSIYTYLKLNKQAPAPDDIPVEFVKQFRLWFANFVLDNTLVDFNDEKSLTDYQKRIKAILKYWAADMNTPLIKELELFYNNTISTVTNTAVSCGCGGTTGTSMNLNIFPGTFKCNPIDELYKSYINNTVSILSDIQGFWKEFFTTDMIDWVIRYLEYIIKYNLPLNFNSAYNGSQLTCSMTNKLAELNAESKQMIENIITSLNLIKECRENEQFNFVNKAMTNFGKIYPYLQWN